MPDSVKDNQLLKIIYNRRSVRRFTEEPVPDDVFTAILEAGRLAPCTVNMQTYSFAVFNNDQWRAKFEHFIPFRGTRAVIVMADTYRLRQVLNVFPYSPLVEHTMAVMNASLAAMNMNIAAEALGVSSVMLSDTGQTGLLNADFLREKLELPETVLPLMTMVFGYARSAYPPMLPRLSLDQIVFTDTYKATEENELKDWIDQMEEGFKAIRPGASFARQLETYSNKIGQAEASLSKLVYYKKQK